MSNPITLTKTFAAGSWSVEISDDGYSINADGYNNSIFGFKPEQAFFADLLVIYLSQENETIQEFLINPTLGSTKLSFDFKFSDGSDQTQITWDVLASNVVLDTEAGGTASFYGRFEGKAQLAGLEEVDVRTEIGFTGLGTDFSNSERIGSLFIALASNYEGFSFTYTCKIEETISEEDVANLEVIYKANSEQYETVITKYKKGLTVDVDSYYDSMIYVADSEGNQLEFNHMDPSEDFVINEDSTLTLYYGEDTPEPPAKEKIVVNSAIPLSIYDGEATKLEIQNFNVTTDENGDYLLSYDIVNSTDKYVGLIEYTPSLNFIVKGYLEGEEIILAAPVSIGLDSVAFIEPNQTLSIKDYNLGVNKTELESGLGQNYALSFALFISGILADNMESPTIMESAYAYAIQDDGSLLTSDIITKEINIDSEGTLSVTPEYNKIVVLSAGAVIGQVEETDVCIFVQALANSYEVNVNGDSSGLDNAKLFNGYLEPFNLEYQVNQAVLKLETGTATVQGNYDGYSTIRFTNPNDVEVTVWVNNASVGTIAANGNNSFNVNGTNGIKNTAEYYFSADGYENSDTQTFDYYPILPQLEAGTATVQGNYDGYSTIRFTNPNDVAATLYINGTSSGTIEAESYKDVNVNGTNLETNTAEYYLAASGYQNSETQEVNYTPVKPELEDPEIISFQVTRDAAFKIDRPKIKWFSIVKEELDKLESTEIITFAVVKEELPKLESPEIVTFAVVSVPNPCTVSGYRRIDGSLVIMSGVFVR